MNYLNIDLDGQVGDAAHFRWKEFLHLPSWEVYCYPTTQQAENLEDIAAALEEIRKILGNLPMKITSGLRPEIYNEYISGSMYSQHRYGSAADFQHASYSPNKVRGLLEPHLNDLGIRMENLPGSSWVHIDHREPGRGGRFFLP